MFWTELFDNFYLKHVKSSAESTRKNTFVENDPAVVNSCERRNVRCMNAWGVCVSSTCVCLPVPAFPLFTANNNTNIISSEEVLWKHWSVWSQLSLCWRMNLFNIRLTPDTQFGTTTQDLCGKCVHVNDNITTDTAINYTTPRRHL